MSLILDAINRSQRERAAPGEVPGVATVHYAGATAAPGAWRQGLLGLLLVIAVGVIAWLLLRPEPVAERAAPTPSADRAAQPAAVPPPPAVTPHPKADSPAPAADRAGSRPAVAPEVAALYAEPASPGSAPGEQSDPRATLRASESPGKAAAGKASAENSSAEQTSTETASTEKASLEKAARKPVPETTVSEPAGREEQALDVEALLRAAQREMGSEELSEHPAPFLSALSQQRKDAIPTLLYSAHDYRGGNGNSTVLINGKTARAGQALGKGVTVVEILPDSVVLEFSGKQFRLRALNSWVNL